MQELYIDSPAALIEFCEQIRGSEWLALDTEFVREKTYYPQFCLLQISNGQLAACIDPIALEDLGPLVEIIYDPSIVKVFHAGRQDLEIFHQIWGSLPSPVFDTQLAATLLGLGDQVGYGNLVQTLLKHELDKGLTRTDWSRRPLEKAQLRYALDDVIYLGEIYHKLRQQLIDQGRESWLAEDFSGLTDPATYNVDPDTLWQRIKGRQHLRGVQLAVLQRLTAWRETEAQTHNRPKRWILKDEVLVDLARRQPADLQKMQQIRGLEPGAVKRWGELILELIRESKQLPKEQWPREKRIPQKLNANQDALTDLLMAALRLQADHHNITPSALCTRKELERLISGDRDLEILHGWRRALAGKGLLEVLEGRQRPAVVNGVLALQPATE
ncbi:MAG: ribonuclease D [Sedimenticola sp.]|nr:MAG: ribonuclease D [Sedimenticola sp.]